MTKQTPLGGLGPEGPLTPLPRPAPRPYTQVLIAFLAGSGGLLLFLALPALIGAETLIDWLKCLVLALAATAVAYGVNRLALDYGARQAAVGMIGAAALSIGSMLFVGTGIFTATHSGFTIEQTEQRRLAAHTSARAQYIAAQQQASQSRADPAPVLRAIAEDMDSKARCEAARACVTNKGASEGPISKLFGTEAGRARVILREVEAVEASRAAALEALTDLQDQAQGVVTGDLSRTDRRSGVQDLGAQIDQQLAALDGSAADGLIASYAAELASTAQQVGDPNAARIFVGYAQSLGAAVPAATLAPSIPRPAMPAPAGVSDTLTEIGAFLPIALIVATVELVFPLSLWLYTMLSLRAQVVRNGESAPTPPAAPRTTRQDRARKPQSGRRRPND